MNKKQLIRTSLLISFLGLIILSIGIANYTPLETSISKIDNSLIGDYVIVCGLAEKTYTGKTFTSFVLVENQSNVKVISFDDVNVDSGKIYCVEGRVELYKKDLEIIADRIEEGMN